MFASTRTAVEAEVEVAVRDLETRTLANLRGGLTRLVYLSSTRDYNTGEYQHDGLTHQFGAQVAQLALAQCHQAAFQDLLYSSLPSWWRNWQPTLTQQERREKKSCTVGGNCRPFAYWFQPRATS